MTPTTTLTDMARSLIVHQLGAYHIAAQVFKIYQSKHKIRKPHLKSVFIYKNVWKYFVLIRAKTWIKLEFNNIYVNLDHQMLPLNV